MQDPEQYVRARLAKALQEASHAHTAATLDDHVGELNKITGRAVWALVRAQQDLARLDERRRRRRRTQAKSAASNNPQA